MRIIFAILGVAAIVVAVFAYKEALTRHDDFYVTRIGGTISAAAGIVLLIGARMRYRGHWSFIIGVTMIWTAVFMASMELDNYQAGSAKSWETGISVSLGFFFAGVLSLWSAHKLHTYARIAEKQNATNTPAISR